MTIRHPSARVLVSLVAVAAASTAGVVAYRVTSSVPVQSTATISNWRRFVVTERAVYGDPRASVAIVVFTDFQCAYRAMLATQLDTLKQRYRDDLFVVIRHSPAIRRHPEAWAAALAVECATDAGRRLEMYHVLSGAHDRLGAVSWGSLAELAGVRDTLALMQCVHRETHASRIVADMVAGRELGITGTPSTLVNGQLIRGVSALEVLDAIVRQASSRSGRVD